MKMNALFEKITCCLIYAILAFVFCLIGLDMFVESKQSDLFLRCILEDLLIETNVRYLLSENQINLKSFISLIRRLFDFFQNKIIEFKYSV